MSSAPEEPGLRFLFDEHVSARAMDQLRAGGVDVVNVSDVGLGGRDDGVVFNWARESSRILVTRNYRDFGPLVEEAARRGLPFPGVFFLSASLPGSDPGAHVRGLELWISRAHALGRNPIENTFGWIDPP